MPDLAVSGLEVRFPGMTTPALDVPALDLAAGARLAVTGGSGSGKTTLLNMLIGLDRVGRGSVRWGGTDLATLSEGKRDRWRAAHVGLVMQDFHLFPGLTALDNVLLPARLARLGRQGTLQESAAALLGRVGIDRHAQATETLSRGQMQRVAVARALVHRPAVIVADEPTASLDAEAGVAVADLLLDLAREAGATLIVASHDKRLVERLGRVLNLVGGRVASDGPQAA